MPPPPACQPTAARDTPHFPSHPSQRILALIRYILELPDTPRYPYDRLQMKIRSALALVPISLATGATSRPYAMAAGALALMIALTAAGSVRVHGRAYPYGAPPGTTGGFGEPNCQLCHFGGELNEPAGSLTIEGLPERYTPGQAYRLIVRLRRPQMAAAGFQLSIRTAAGAQAGTLAPADSGRAKVEAARGIQYAGHTEPGSRVSTPGAAEWPLLWTAPATQAGLLTLSAAANAADGDHSPLGDYVYAVERTAVPR